MQSLLWYEGLIFLGDSTTTVAEWAMPPHRSLDFGDANQAYVTLEYSLSGPGAATAAVGLQRSAARVELDAAFESMEPTSGAAAWLLPSGTGAGDGVVSASYGVDQVMATAANIRKLPRGIGRIVAQNTGTAGNWAVVWVRCSIALVRG